MYEDHRKQVNKNVLSNVVGFTHAQQCKAGVPVLPSVTVWHGHCTYPDCLQCTKPTVRNHPSATGMGVAAEPSCLHHSWQERRTDSLQCKAQGDNYLTSTIPASWLRVGSLPRLFYFSLAQNELVGTIPMPEPYCSLCGFRVGRPRLHQPG